jgi:hypothetical protein
MIAYRRLFIRRVEAGFPFREYKNIGDFLLVQRDRIYGCDKSDFQAV